MDTAKDCLGCMSSSPMCQTEHKNYSRNSLLALQKYCNECPAIIYTNEATLHRNFTSRFDFWRFCNDRKYITHHIPPTLIPRRISLKWSHMNEKIMKNKRVCSGNRCTKLIRFMCAMNRMASAYDCISFLFRHDRILLLHLRFGYCSHTNILKHFHNRVVFFSFRFW